MSQKKARNKNKKLIDSDRDSDKQDNGILKIPVLTLTNTVVFPFTLSPLVIDSDSSIKTVQQAMASNRLIGLFPELPEQALTTKNESPGVSIEEETIDGKKVTKIGVLSRVVKLLRFPDGTVRILVRGLGRIRHVSSAGEEKDGVLYAVVEKIKLVKEKNIEIAAMVKNALNQFQEIISYSPNFPEELKVAILNIDDNDRLIDMIADTLNISTSEKIRMLAVPSLHERLQFLTILLNREVEVIHLGTEIQSQVHNALSKTQREYFLREQLKTIKKELGDDMKNPDITAIEENIAKLTLPDHVLKTIKKESERLKMIPQASSEYNVAYTYIDWLLEVPWSNFSRDSIDVTRAAKILDKDHYDLKKVKERILEFLAVLQLKKDDKKSPILCFVGPPGVGKTSLGQSIARAMGRKFVRMSLGGIKDEAEIRGHRRTYVGALPGRIIQGLKKAGTSNPVFMLDEIDKIGNDFRGDPASALLEVLDPQQNHAFNDHYLELDYDLSSVMFIATANILDTIPPALLDRMEIIRLPGYTAMEKKQIAKKFLIPRQIKENGLNASHIKISPDATDEIINYYTREAGVRSLEREIGALCRKTARKIVESGENKKRPVTIIDAKKTREFLGPRRFFMDEAERKSEPGLATGMAWTSDGGTIMPIEATMMPGKGELKLTGSLGDVMKESAITAFSYIKSKHELYKIDSDLFTKKDFHVHVPDGATPKDGPSAGITITAALVSLMTGKPVRAGLAMTGEMTLRGKISPVGGIKEKVIAAHRVGIKKIALPEKNRKDLEDIPDEVKKKISFNFFETASDALDFVLEKGKPGKVRK
ncbi:MAG: endopeptidase La [Lentisphaerae bacterium GWF2_45_14]|nr:MAG: endopeptidase La [Lentisphaerae bacterium GWF2_45_14]